MDQIAYKLQRKYLAFSLKLRENQNQNEQKAQSLFRFITDLHPNVDPHDLATQTVRMNFWRCGGGEALKERKCPSLGLRAALN